MSKLIVATVVAAASFGSFASVAAASDWTPVKAENRCAVGVPAPAMDLGNKITFTCDSQENTGGYNLKMLGEASPIKVKVRPGQYCVPRLDDGAGVTFTLACKFKVQKKRYVNGELQISGVYDVGGKQYYREYEIRNGRSTPLTKIN